MIHILYFFLQIGPSIAELLEILGKDASLERMQSAIKLVDSEIERQKNRSENEEENSLNRSPSQCDIMGGTPVGNNGGSGNTTLFTRCVSYFKGI